MAFRRFRVISQNHGDGSFLFGRLTSWQRCVPRKIRGLSHQRYMGSMLLRYTKHGDQSCVFVFWGVAEADMRQIDVAMPCTGFGWQRLFFDWCPFQGSPFL